MTSSIPGGTEIFPARADIVVPAGILGPEPSTFDVSAFVVRLGAGIVLVDTLMQPDHVEVIRDALSRAGAGFGDVDHIVLTHSHPDHTGGLAAVAVLAPQARIVCGAGDVAAITGSTGVAVEAVARSSVASKSLRQPGTPPDICACTTHRHRRCSSAMSSVTTAVAGSTRRPSSPMTPIKQLRRCATWSNGTSTERCRHTAHR